MKRRNFLKSMGIGSLSVPLTIQSISEIEVLEDQKTNIPEQQKESNKLKTINLIAPIQPKKRGKAIRLYTNMDNADVSDQIIVPLRYFNSPPNLRHTQLYSVVEKKSAGFYFEYKEMIINNISYPVRKKIEFYEYTCFPANNDLQLDVEIPTTQKLIINKNHET